MRRLDPLLKWLVIDGYGFHEGYFHSHRWLLSQAPRPALSPFGQRVFDQGLGRSLWFVQGGDVARMAEAVSALPPSRHGDLWSGVGLACAYAGQASTAELEALLANAGAWRLHLAQGVTFGAEARVRGGIANDFTEQACRTVCGRGAEAAAQLTRAARDGLDLDADDPREPLYERWRAQIRQALSHEVPVCN